jgi:hypothetical protein
MAFAPNPDPSRRCTIGERLDFRLELDCQTFEAMGAQLEEQQQRIAGLERAVAVLEALIVGTEVAR